MNTLFSINDEGRERVVIILRRGRTDVHTYRTVNYVCNFSVRCFRQERPYHDDSTASRLLSEVKHRRVELVLRWGTTLESSMLFFLFATITAFQDLEDEA